MLIIFTFLMHALQRQIEDLLQSISGEAHNYDALPDLLRPRLLILILNARNNETTRRIEIYDTNCCTCSLDSNY